MSFSHKTRLFFATFKSIFEDPRADPKKKKKRGKELNIKKSHFFSFLPRENGMVTRASTGLSVTPPFANQTKHFRPFLFAFLLPFNPIMTLTEPPSRLK
jgi:hypothetical protein